MPRPKPSDTIPCMISPGEFVLNRGAVELMGGGVAVANLNKLGLQLLKEFEKRGYTHDKEKGYFHEKNKGYYIPEEVQGFADGTLDPQGVQPAPSFGSQPTGSSLPNLNYGSMVAANGGQARSFADSGQQVLYNMQGRQLSSQPQLGFPAQPSSNLPQLGKPQQRQPTQNQQPAQQKYTPTPIISASSDWQPDNHEFTLSDYGQRIVDNEKVGLTLLR